MQGALGREDPVRRVRGIAAVAGAVYLVWWLAVEGLLPGSFNPLASRVLVVAIDGALVAASFATPRVARNLSRLFTAWVCLLVAHYTYLVIGNRGESTWWEGAFVTFAASAMCLESPAEVAVFSAFSLASVLYAAAALGQLRHSIYVPGLATILLLANLTKRSQWIARDATARAEAAKAAAEAANRELEAFNDSVAHDLRAPLRAIAGFSRIVLDGLTEGSDPESREHLERVVAAAKHMDRLVDGLLALGQVTRVGLRRQWVDLTALAKEIAGRLQAAQPDRAVELVIAEGLRERGDEVLLGAALENLLSNAWKFTRDASRARIEVGATRDGSRTTYFVRDNGAGFDMAYAPKLFGVFQRLHGAGEFEGMGIGLATVRRIVERHGGRVWAEGKVGQGACLSFTFEDEPEGVPAGGPRGAPAEGTLAPSVYQAAPERASSPAPVVSRSPDVGPGASAESKTLRVLLVEDSKDDADLIVDVLRSGGFTPEAHRVATRTDLKAALASRAWDTILSDNALPSYGGLAALADVQSAGLDIPFILVSGTIGETVAVESMRAGARDYVLKRDLTRLPAAVARELGERSIRLETQRMREQLRISERMATAGMLAAGVVHEISNPLAVALANVEYFMRKMHEGQPEEEVPRALADTAEALERIRDIVVDVKMFSRPLDETTGEVDLRAVLDSSVRLSATEVRYRATIEKDYQAVPPVRASASRLGQVFVNLIVNAAQAIPEGRVEEHRIRVAACTGEGGWAEVDVSDTGCGIPPQEMDRIFDPFFTTKPAGVGTGLGLAICHRIVVELGGRIAVESTVGKGTTFRLAFPPAATTVRSAT